MGNDRVQSSPLQERPPGIKQLNDSVWEFHKPTTPPAVQIIFFHGLQLSNFNDAVWRTWSSPDGTLWPKEWLSESVPDAHILSISYNSYAPRHQRDTDVHVFTENLIYDVIEDVLVGQDCPVILVGHSLGGIIVKEFILGCNRRKEMLNPETFPKALERIDKFLKNVKGVFFYSTPGKGSKLADSKAISPDHNEPFMKLLKILTKETTKINDSFASIRPNIPSDAINERPNTKELITKRLFKEVPWSSYQTDVAPEADHFDICKPRNTTDVSFVKLVKFINKVVGEIGLVQTI